MYLSADHRDEISERKRPSPLDRQPSSRKVAEDETRWKETWRVREAARRAFSSLPPEIKINRSRLEGIVVIILLTPAAGTRRRSFRDPSSGKLGCPRFHSTKKLDREEENSSEESLLIFTEREREIDR